MTFKLPYQTLTVRHFVLLILYRCWLRRTVLMFVQANDQFTFYCLMVNHNRTCPLLCRAEPDVRGILNTHRWKAITACPFFFFFSLLSNNIYTIIKQTLDLTVTQCWAWRGTCEFLMWNSSGLWQHALVFCPSRRCSPAPTCCSCVMRWHRENGGRRHGQTALTDSDPQQSVKPRF